MLKRSLLAAVALCATPAHASFTASSLTLTEDVIEQAISSGRGETDLRPHAAAETAYEVFTCTASGDDELT